MRARLAVIVLVLAACAACATVQTNPTPDAQQQVRLQAYKALAATEAALGIVDEVGRLTEQLPVPQDVRVAIGCWTVKAVGARAIPDNVRAGCQPVSGTLPACVDGKCEGVLQKAVPVLTKLTTRAELSATLKELFAAVDPLIEKLEASTVAPLRALAVALRVTFAAARGLV